MRWIQIVVLCLILSAPAMARPEFLARFTADPLSSPQFKNRCATCHINPAGGGDRNDFGRAFAANNFTITPDLRARFPERFQYPVQIVDPQTEVHYSDPSGKTVLLKRDGRIVVIDPSVPPSSSTAAAPPPTVTPGTQPAPAAGAVSEWDRPLQISSRWINLPRAAPVERNQMGVVIGHRFSAPLFVGSAASLLGLDSPANIALGWEYGLWDGLLASVSRTRSDRNIEMGVTAAMLQQGQGVPLSLAARVGVEGRDNFREFYSPHLQVMAEGRIGRRVEVLAAPGIVFNAQDNTFDFLRPFATHPESDYTMNLGLGLLIHVTPSFSVMGEYVPRVAGFRGYFVDRPAVSLALQKQTFHHVFNLVISTSTSMSPATYGPNIGPDSDPRANRLKLGFNIYRRLK